MGGLTGRWNRRSSSRCRGASRLRAVSEDLEAGAVSSAMIFRLGTEYADRAGTCASAILRDPGGRLDGHGAGDRHGGRAVELPLRRDLRVLRIDAARASCACASGCRARARSWNLRRFSYEDGVPEVYSELVEQEQITVYRVAIPEGLTSWQIVAGPERRADFLSGEVADIPAGGRAGAGHLRGASGGGPGRDPGADAARAGGDPGRGLGRSASMGCRSKRRKRP
jgi:UPF0755 protein